MAYYACFTWTLGVVTKSSAVVQKSRTSLHIILSVLRILIFTYESHQNSATYRLVNVCISFLLGPSFTFWPWITFDDLWWHCIPNHEDTTETAYTTSFKSSFAPDSLNALAIYEMVNKDEYIYIFTYVRPHFILMTCTNLHHFRYKLILLLYKLKLTWQ